MESLHFTWPLKIVIHTLILICCAMFKQNIQKIIMELQSLAEKLDFFAFSFMKWPYVTSLKTSYMLLKIPDFLKISLNVYEIYLHEFLFQNTKHF